MARGKRLREKINRFAGDVSAAARDIPEQAGQFLGDFATPQDEDLAAANKAKRLAGERTTQEATTATDIAGGNFIPEGATPKGYTTIDGETLPNKTAATGGFLPPTPEQQAEREALADRGLSTVGGEGRPGGVVPDPNALKPGQYYAYSGNGPASTNVPGVAGERINFKEEFAKRDATDSGDGSFLGPVQGNEYRGVIRATPEAIERTRRGAARQGLTREGKARLDAQERRTAERQSDREARQGLATTEANAEVATAVAKAAGGDQQATQAIALKLAELKQKDTASYRSLRGDLYRQLSISWAEQREAAGNDQDAIDALGDEAGYIARGLNAFEPKQAVSDQAVASTQQPTAAPADGGVDANSNNIPDEEEGRFSGALAAIQEYEALPENDPRRQSSAAVYEKAKVAKAAYLAKYKQQLG